MPDCSSALSAVIECHTPSLDELKQVFETSLRENFQHVQVDIVKCPDTSEPPFEMTSTGFGKDMRIAEVGGPGNIYPVVRKENQFSFKKIAEVCQLPDGHVMGPGAGPWPIIGVNCEMVADANCAANKFETRVIKIEELTEKRYELSRTSEPTFNLLANLAISKPNDRSSDVVHFKCSVRTGKKNLPETIRQGLATKFGNTPVSMAGVFILDNGKAKIHVMPDFPSCAWGHEKEVNEWLRFFEMPGPLVNVSVIHSYDPGHKLRLEHTHCYSSQNQGDGGHYHYDVSPETVSYEGWFAPAQKIYRIDEI
ncbi:hypothetical protein WR25_19241 [Diploscapter pachys]|uniref:DUF1907 domain-containing protein n=1 Tax=Diploscapter pachys TaxID=2018661 RepID=A0A2A2LYD7_9BILA|nr:hypothetical protein WR25_19241 [Diploscapter pachys]